MTRRIGVGRQIHILHRWRQHLARGEGLHHVTNLPPITRCSRGGKAPHASRIADPRRSEGARPLPRVDVPVVRVVLRHRPECPTEQLTVTRSTGTCSSPHTLPTFLRVVGGERHRLDDRGHTWRSGLHCATPGDGPFDNAERAQPTKWAKCDESPPFESHCSYRQVIRQRINSYGTGG